MADYNIDQTRELLLKVWSVLLMALYGVGFLREKMLVQQAEALKVDVLSDVAKLFFFALMFVAFLIDIVEMREDKKKGLPFFVFIADARWAFRNNQRDAIPCAFLGTGSVAGLQNFKWNRLKFLAN